MRIFLQKVNLRREMTEKIYGIYEWRPHLKQWVAKLLQQLEINLDSEQQSRSSEEHPIVNEEKATLLFMIDTYNKHLFEIDKHSIRKVREKLDAMSK